MIALTLLDRQPIELNCDLIAWVTAHPDTTLRMVTGESLVVREPVDEVIRRIVAFRARVLSAAGLADALAATGARGACAALDATRAAADVDEGATP